jgi:hypothetical protein
VVGRPPRLFEASDSWGLDCADAQGKPGMGLRGVNVDGWEGPNDGALERARLLRELNENALREMELAVRIDELERNRWAAFTLVELEWISTATVDPQGDAEAEALPDQANAELERRARASVRLDDDLDADLRPN